MDPTSPQTVYHQPGHDVRCCWGPEAVSRLAPSCDAIVVVDVLSFTTACTVAVEQGAMVYPYRHADATAAEFAQSVGAKLAGPRGGGLSLSPASLAAWAAPGARIVVPSPNGATLSLGTGATPTFAGCLRNASAVARAARAFGPRVAVVPAGERWDPEGTLRPAIEDWLGAGAICAALGGAASPEAALAAAAFEAVRERLAEMLRGCASGQELITRGFGADVDIAAAHDATDCVPWLSAGAYHRWAGVAIRPARADEQDVVRGLFREYQVALGVDLCFQGFEAELAGLPGDYAGPGGGLWLATRDGEALGVVAIRPMSEAGACEMKRLYVRPGARGTGTGRQLALRSIAAARAAGYRSMRLDTLRELEVAIALYRDLGFVEIPAYYDNPIEDVVYMELALGASR